MKRPHVGLLADHTVLPYYPSLPYHGSRGRAFLFIRSYGDGQGILGFQTLQMVKKVLLCGSPTPHPILQ
jgi:hypothetical protein